MGAAQRSLYEQFLAGVRGNLLKKVRADGTSAHRMEILEALLRLRQICCHPLLVSAEVGESAKMEALLQDVETVIAEGRKALIYSQFTSLLSLLGKRLKELSIPYAYLDGSTKNREECVRQFQEDPQLPLFLISLKAGGVGLNLTAADYVFLYDPWWNEAAENQAIDRAHRIGRKETVIAKRYITIESVEEKMMTLKAHKRSLVDHLLEEGGAPETLSIDDLAFLFS
jgi:SNF2 family DNA or RNA helicase